MIRSSITTAIAAAAMMALLPMSGAGALEFFDYLSAAKVTAVQAGDDDVYVDTEFAAALADSAAQGGAALHFPAGRYNFQSGIDLDQKIRIHGDGSGLYGGGLTRFSMQNDGHGWLTNHPSTQGGIIEGIMITGDGDYSGVAHGLVMRSRMTLRDIHIRDFSTGNCLYVTATGGAQQSSFNYGNANNFRIDNALLQYCVNGLVIDGADTNAGLITGFDFRQNDEWGAIDDSFLFNTFIGGHFGYNGTGPIKTVGDSQITVLVSPYNEGAKLADLENKTLVLGGNLGSTGGHHYKAGEQDVFGIDDNGNGTETRHTALGMKVIGDGDHGQGWRLGTWDDGEHSIIYRHANLANRTPLRFTTNLSEFDLQGGGFVPAGEMIGGEIFYKKTNGKHEKFKFRDVADQIADLEQRIADLEAAAE